jgi:hypothetical protein
MLWILALPSTNSPTVFPVGADGFAAVFFPERPGILRVVSELQLGVLWGKVVQRVFGIVPLIYTCSPSKR